MPFTPVVDMGPKTLIHNYLAEQGVAVVLSGCVHREKRGCVHREKSCCSACIYHRESQGVNPACPGPPNKALVLQEGQGAAPEAPAEAEALGAGQAGARGAAVSGLGAPQVQSSC